MTSEQSVVGKSRAGRSADWLRRVDRPTAWNCGPSAIAVMAKAPQAASFTGAGIGAAGTGFVLPPQRQTASCWDVEEHVSAVLAAWQQVVRGAFRLHLHAASAAAQQDDWSD